ncbi:hypothetical protein CERSUDRAFT_87113 [Gelatoporia subvermispora B]|uniref:Zn(2)-C6 fungal-type domain-containing protein n=1 Tax=Ceriporiopsis subvermispora (strain B) TaxID=914234 RepID=M2QA35_CERS8|nr:hypothetical protein CERSUDRAFT_87113 [Gelatoporia subvermispora B]
MYYPAPLDASIAHDEEAGPSYPGYLQSDVEGSWSDTSMLMGSSQVSVNDLPPEVELHPLREPGLSAMADASGNTPGSPTEPTRKGKRPRAQKGMAAGQHDLQPFEQVLDLGIETTAIGDDTAQMVRGTSEAGVAKRTRKEKGPRTSCACDLCHALKLRCLKAPGESMCGTCVKTNLDLPAEQQVVCESTRTPQKKGRRSNSVKAAMRMMGLIA